MIRQAVAADVPRVIALAETWAASGEMVGYEVPPESVLQAALGQCFFVAESGEGLVGYVWGQVKRDSVHIAVVPPSADYLDIEDLYVVPSLRSHGIGRELVGAAKAWAAAGGIRFVLVYSSTRQVDRVLHFYRKCGFVSWSVQLFADLEREAVPRSAHKNV